MRPKQAYWFVISAIVTALSGASAALMLAARTAARGKLRSSEVAAFMLDPAPRCQALAQELESGSYHPGRPRPFVIREPKRRLIAALPFRDRVVQHLLVSASMPALEAWFAPQSYACRAGMGTHRALRRACDLQRALPWLLRIDLAKFFPSIDHERLLRLILPRTPRTLRWLAERIVRDGGPCERTDFHFPGDDLLTPLTHPRGLSIGNPTSQIWANAILTPVDRAAAVARRTAEPRGRVGRYAGPHRGKAPFNDSAARTATRQ